MKYLRPLLPYAGALAAGLMVVSPPAAQAYNATVTGDINQSKATVPPAGYGVHTSVYDNNFTPASLPNNLKAAGVTTLRYPGGSYADAYHWQTNSATAGISIWINSNDTFDNFMTKDVIPAGANAVITCNYGSNAAGTGGADPNEAAAWVDYANNTKHYGIKYWEIGNEIAGNGFYGSWWETDMHSPATTGSARTGDSRLGPTAYGQNVLQFVTAMKAKDPTIKIGVPALTPGSWPDGVSPDWNSNVLQQCGTKIDFVIIHWYPGGTTANALASSSTIATAVSSLQSKINQYCGSNAPNVKILITETNAGSSAGDGPQQTLFSTDNYLTWFENGALNVDWLELHSNFLSEGVSGLADETPGEGYYGVQLASDVARVGDTLCSASSNNSLLKAHVVNRADNSVGVQLINDDPSNSATVTVTVNNVALSSSGTRHDFGVSNFPSGSMWPSSGMATSTINGIGTNSFTVTVPAYTVSNFIIPKGVAANPTFTATASASPSTIAPGATGTITASFTDTGAAASNLVTDIEVYNSAGAKVSQQTYSGQNFTAGGANTYNWSWTAPATAGTYTVSLGVFKSDWSASYYWGSNAATITVAGDGAQYNFESGTQSWASSGGMIGTLSSSTTKAFAGTHSLAVPITSTGSGSTQSVSIGSPSTAAGKVVTFHIWIPSGSKISAIQPYVQQGSGGNWTWTGNYQTIGNLTANAWNTLTVTVPSNAVTPLASLGVQFSTNGAWTGACYVDSVSW